MEKLIKYYRGDHLLLQGLTPNAIERQICDNITDEYTENDKELYVDHVTETELEGIIDHEDDIAHKENCETDGTSVVQSSSNSCLACKNGDFPTGLHKCKTCQKNVHLFGCSIPASNTEEGCGERICLICADNIVENNAMEKWGKKHSSESSRKTKICFIISF